jgi:hypothetical protein
MSAEYPDKIPYVNKSLCVATRLPDGGTDIRVVGYSYASCILQNPSFLDGNAIYIKEWLDPNGVSVPSALYHWYGIVLTDKKRGERATSYRVFNSLTGQVVMVQKRDNNRSFMCYQDSKTKIPADQKRVILRTIDNWDR